MAGLKLETHPDYDALSAEAAWLELSAAAGTAYKRGVDADGAQVLPMYAAEQETGPDGARKTSSAQYERRVAATPALPILGDYCRQRRDAVMRATISRPALEGDGADDRFKAWAEDVDRAGHDLSSFMASRLYRALVARYEWIGVNSPTAEELRASRHRNPLTTPWAVWAPICNVLDWDIVDGVVQRVAVRTVKRVKASLTDEAEAVKTITEWTPTTVTRYSEEEGGELVGLGEDRNAYGFVPWFRFEPIEGEAYGARFADLQRSILQSRSDMIAEQKANTYTLRFLWGVAPEELTKASTSAGNAYAFTNADGRMDTTSGDPAVMQELRENLRLDLEEARRRSELGASSMERQAPESGVSRAYRRVELSALLAGIAERTEEAEQRLIRMWAKVAGDYAEEAVETMAASAYSRDFDLLADERREELLWQLYQDKGVPIEVRRDALAELATRVWTMPTPRRNELLEAIDRMPANAAQGLMASALSRTSTPGAGFGRPTEPAEAGATN